VKSRERVKRAIGFDFPDRAPISHAILPAARIRHGKALEEILAKVHEDFGWDFLPDMEREDFPALYKRGRNRDDFGTLWDVTEEGLCGIPVEWPLAEWGNYERFKWPEFTAGPPEARLYSGHMAGFSDDYYARGAWITFFEEMQQLRGMENLLADLAYLDLAHKGPGPSTSSGSKELYRLRDDLLEFNLDWIDKWLEHEYDGLHFADDWGSQTSLLISPAAWREFFKPAYRAMFERVTGAGVDVHFHSDGNIVEIIPDLLDMGVKVLNCQAAVIGPALLKRKFRGSVCFRTDLDRQRVVPFGRPEEVKAHILEMFGALGTKRGGIVACGEISPDTPLENIRVMYETFMSYRY
jgi:uroporphyrinogen decarboxylase